MMLFSRMGQATNYLVAGLFLAGLYGVFYGIRRLFGDAWRRRIDRVGKRDDGHTRARGGGSRVVDRRDGLPSQLGAKTLAKVWQRFMRGQPWVHRGSIRDYPQVVLLGPAGAGKSALVDAQVDWQAQKKRFFPSITDDPLLQVYIGSRVVVQEVSPSLLADDSAAARKALVKLWRTSARKQPPAVLLVVDGLHLGNAAPEQLKRQAQLIRGKIDLLQELHGRPLKVSVCLTHMDSFTGFSELVKVTSRNQLPLSVDLQPLARRDAQARIFAARENYLGLALTDSPAESFARIVELMASSGGIAVGLSAFVEPLTTRSRLGQPPQLDKLYFFAPGLEVDRAFQTPAPTGPMPSPVRQLSLRFSWAAGALLMALGLVHSVHAHRVAEADQAVAAYAELGQRDGISATSSELRVALERSDHALTSVKSIEKWWPLLKLSGREHKRQLAQRLVDTTRGAYLLPLLSKGSSRELTLYTIGLLYAAPDNVLGELIAPRSAHWASNLGVPELTVVAYIRWTEHAFSEAVALPSGTEDDPTLSLKPWADFLLALQGAYDSQDVGEDLRPLQTQAGVLADALDRGQRFNQVPALLALLPANTPIDLDAYLSAPHRSEALAWIAGNRLTLTGLLAMVRQGELSERTLGRMMLGALVTHVSQLVGTRSSEAFAVKLGRSYVFARQRWQELLARASVQLYVRQKGYPFLPREATPPADPVLTDAAPGAPSPSEDPYAAAIAAAYQQGTTSAAARARQQQQVLAKAPDSELYHRAVVDGTVRPTLAEFAKQLATSALSPADKATLAAYALEQSNLYAQRYREALFAEYQPYHVNARTARELPQAINELIQPTGGFMRWLRNVAEDADLASLEGLYLRPLAEAVAPLQPIVRLVKPPKDAPIPVSGLSRYVEVVTRLSRDLAGTERPQNVYASAVTFAGSGGPNPFGAPLPPQAGATSDASPAVIGGDEPGGELKALLSPVGRVAMAMLLQPDTSYAAQAQQWLDEAGITDELKRPFLEPFDKVLDFGVPEVEAGLKVSWTKQWSQVSGTFAKYPFRKQASKEVDPTELDALGERGAFWQTFRSTVAPFCILRGGAWAQRTRLLRPVTLPPGMLGRLNLVMRIARIFFDKEGKRAPLELTATPLPLPRELDREGFVTMSFLRAGGASVFGFNQAPTARSFQPNWWSVDGASIGIMFGSPFDKTPDTKPDRSVDASSSPWALYRLIERGRLVGDTLTWTLPGDGFAKRTVVVRFIVRGNPVVLRPWTLFASTKD